MKLKGTVSLLLLGALALSGCDNTATTSNPVGESSLRLTNASALPESGFRAEITLVDAPAKLRVGQRETIQVRIKNGSGVKWYARGGEINTFPDNRYFIAVGNRWLRIDRSLITNMDGRYGIPEDLGAGQETAVPLQITAPASVGEYILEVDVVQEQVAWFSDKGSTPASFRVTVVR